jgi:hypothetical protein
VEDEDAPRLLLIYGRRGLDDVGTDGFSQAADGLVTQSCVTGHGLAGELPSSEQMFGSLQADGQQAVHSDVLNRQRPSPSSRLSKCQALSQDALVAEQATVLVLARHVSSPRCGG